MGVPSPGTGNDIIPGGDDSPPKYTVKGSMVIEGTTGGAAFKPSSFNYETKESLLSFSFVGPSPDLSFTGAENVDVRMTLVDKKSGTVVGRQRHSIDELPAKSEEAVDFKFSRVPQGDYRLEFDTNFECTFLTYDCENQDSYTADVLVPR